MTTSAGDPRPGPAEVTGLGSAQAYAAGMSAAYANAAARTDAFASGLDGHGVHGPAVQAVTRAHELTRQAGEAWAAAEVALDGQNVVRDAYAAAPEAGDKHFLTDHSPTGTTASPSDASRPDPTPLADADPAAVDGFIAAVLSDYPRRSPAGQDLQRRMRDGDEPWVSLPVRSTGVCEHLDTVCPQCVDQWDNDHELRVAATPTAVDEDAHRATADEFYTFEGDPERQAPAYWVARHGRTVTSQITGEPVETVLLHDAENASAAFADGCCDNTPGAPGAIRPGDQIEILGDRSSENTQVNVTGSVATADGFTITGTGEDGRPIATTVGEWNYRITRRPTSDRSGPAEHI